MDTPQYIKFEMFIEYEDDRITHSTNIEFDNKYIVMLVLYTLLMVPIIHKLTYMTHSVDD